MNAVEKRSRPKRNWKHIKKKCTRNLVAAPSFTIQSQKQITISLLNVLGCLEFVLLHILRPYFDRLENTYFCLFGF